MINDLTIGVLATSSGARVYAFVSDTCTIGRTIGIEDTFGPASFVGVSKVFGQTLTRTCTILLLTNGVNATRIGNTRR